MSDSTEYKVLGCWEGNTILESNMRGNHVQLLASHSGEWFLVSTENVTPVKVEKRKYSHRIGNCYGTCWNPNYLPSFNVDVQRNRLIWSV